MKRALPLLALLVGCATGFVLLDRGREIRLARAALVDDVVRGADGKPVLLASAGNFLPPLQLEVFAQAQPPWTSSFSITGTGTADKFVCTATSGKCLTLQTANTTIDGPGVNDDLKWDGTNIVMGSGNGHFVAGGYGLSSQAGNLQGMTYSGGDVYFSAFATTNEHVWRGGGSIWGRINSRGLRLTAGVLPECGDGSPATEAVEGQIFMVAATSSTATKQCVCTLDDTATPVFRWVNSLINNAGTGIGTTTTCP